MVYTVFCTEERRDLNYHHVYSMYCEKHFILYLHSLPTLIGTRVALFRDTIVQSFDYKTQCIKYRIMQIKSFMFTLMNVKLMRQNWENGISRVFDGGLIVGARLNNLRNGYFWIFSCPASHQMILGKNLI